MLDMDLTSVKYEVPDTTSLKIQVLFIQRCNDTSLRIFALVYSGCKYPMEMHDSGSFNYIKISVCNNNKNITGKFEA